VALCNKGHRYFIPPQFNYFGCIGNFERCLHPKCHGGNSLLLPMDDTTLDIIIPALDFTGESARLVILLLLFW
jgi:hypothetical protein